MADKRKPGKSRAWSAKRVDALLANCGRLLSGSTQHRFAGDCPERIPGWENKRDPLCAACKALGEIEAARKWLGVKPKGKRGDAERGGVGA